MILRQSFSPKTFRPGRIFFIASDFGDVADPSIAGDMQIGRFRTAPADSRSVSFTWSGDTAGQGWGIDPAQGGMRTYRTVAGNDPDFFIHSGDTIYADCPVERELKLADGGIWQNVVTEEKSAVAQTLAQFRGNYKYNLLDEHQRAFNAQVPIFAQWDDHEVTNDWSPQGTFDASGFASDGQSKLVMRARRAFHEFMPTRRIAEEDGRVSVHECIHFSCPTDSSSHQHSFKCLQTVGFARRFVPS